MMTFLISSHLGLSTESIFEVGEPIGKILLFPVISDHDSDRQQKRPTS
jgi:hypothetical protein